MAQTKGSQDRRDHPRVEKLNLAQISRFDEESFSADLAVGRTLDISHGGVRLELYHPVPLRSVLNLTLALNDELIEVAGTVVHLEVLDADRCAMGVEFTDLSDDARRLIDAHVAAAGAA